MNKISMTREGQLEKYVIHHDGEWAQVIYDPSGTIFFYTSRGNYNYAWYAIGSDTLKEFLIRLNFDYAMSKFIGRDDELNTEKSVQVMREHIISYRRDATYSKEQAREMWEAVDEIENTHDSEFSLALQESKFSNHCNYWYDMLYYDYPKESYRFWDRIWLPLMEYWKEEIKNTNKTKTCTTEQVN